MSMLAVSGMGWGGVGWGEGGRNNVQVNDQPNMFSSLGTGVPLERGFWK